MLKLLKRVFLGLVAIILLLTLALYVFVTFFAPLDLIKDYVADKLEAELGLPVSIEKVSSDLFSGIKIQGIKIDNPKGFSKTPLLYVKSVNLKYNLWAIIKGKLSIHKIDIVSPKIAIEKNTYGKMNLPKKKPASVPQKGGTPAGKKDSSPVNLLISSFSLKNGEVAYRDLSGAKAKTFGVKKLNAKVSGILFSLLKPIKASVSGTIVMGKKQIPLSVSTSIGVNLKAKKFESKDLDINIGGEKLSGIVTVETPASGIKADFYLGCNKLSIENLLGVLGLGAASAKKKAATTEAQAKTKTLALSVPTNIQVHGILALNNLYYRKLKIEETKTEITLKHGRLYIKSDIPNAYKGTFALNGTILLNQPNLGYQIKSLYLKNFDASAFSKDVVDSFMPDLVDKKEWKEKFHGKLSFSVTGAGGGIKVKDILAKSRFQGILSLKDGKLVHLKSLEQIAETLKTPALAQDLEVKELSSDFKLYNGTLTLSNTKLDDTDLRVRFKGSADLINQKWIAGNLLTLIFSQSFSATLPEEYSALKNSKGEAEVDLELTGSLKKPIPVPKLDKAMQRVIQKIAPQILKQIRDRIPLLQNDIQQQKEELEKQAKQQAEEEAKKQQEAAQKKLEEEAQKQLKNLLPW